MTSKIFGNLFLSVGAMKAGTTWLYVLLDRHPQLYFTLEKEIHYFYHRYVNSRHLSEERRLTEAKNRYLTRFEPGRANIDRIRGNLHWVANYLQSPVDDFWYKNLFSGARDSITYNCDFSNLHAQVPAEAWPQISAQCDKLRVLYTMRDPIKRLWSHVKFHMQMTGQTEKLDTWGPRDFEKFARSHHIWVNAEYGAVLRRLHSGLAPEQLKVIFYEDMHADQRGVLRNIEEFLDLPAHNYPQHVLERRFTESISKKMPDFFPGLFAKDIRRIVGEIEDAGYRVPAKWTLPG
ncbi:MAG: sulfotransferase [Rhodobacteraceae bacterium]|nr:sulfotransferase [Paracoccaceae bacterium]